MKKTIANFVGMNCVEDSKDLDDTNCLRCKNMTILDGLFKTRQGCVKVGSQYPERINLIYSFSRSVSSNKTLIASGGNLYYQ